MADTLEKIYVLLQNRNEWIQKQYKIIEQYEEKAYSIEDEEKKLKLLDVVLAGFQSCSELMSQLAKASEILRDQAEEDCYDESKFQEFDIVSLSLQELVDKYFQLKH